MNRLLSAATRGSLVVGTTFYALNNYQKLSDIDYTTYLPYVLSYGKVLGASVSAIVGIQVANHVTKKKHDQMLSKTAEYFGLPFAPFFVLYWTLKWIWTKGIDRLADLICNLPDYIWRFIQYVCRKIGKFLNFVLDVLEWCVRKLISVIEWIWHKFVWVLNRIYDLLAWVCRQIEWVFCKIGEFFTWVMNGIERFLNWCLTSLCDLLNAVGRFIRWFVTGFFNVIWDSIVSLVRGTRKYGMMFLRFVYNYIMLPVWRMMVSVWNGMYDMANTVYTISCSVANGIYTVSCNVASGIYNVGCSVANGIYNVGCSVSSAVYDVSCSVSNGVYNVGCSVGNAVYEISNSVGSSIAGAFGQSSQSTTDTNTTHEPNVRRSPRFKTD